jgi:hypothetical protein
MNNYLAWNNALGEYFFPLSNEGRRTTLYVDRRRIEAIGQQHGLGGWTAFLKTAATPVPTTYVMPEFNTPHPLVIADHLRKLWSMRQGTIAGVGVEQLSFPPILIGLSLLVLAWTENELLHKRSYYERLALFLQVHFPAAQSRDWNLNNTVARRLADTLPALHHWLKLRHGGRRGELLLGRSTHQRWVGTLRFHALLDQDERDLLPALWTSLGLQVRHPISTPRLLELVMQYPKLEQLLPLLSKSFRQLEQRKLIAELLHAEFHVWDGLPLVVRAPRVLHRSLKIRIRFEDGLPVHVCIDWPGEPVVLHGQGKSYRIRKPTHTSMGILVDAATDLDVIPDETWLFGEIVLHNNMLRARRAARQHLWLWPASSLGYGGSGFIESSRFLEDSAFLLITRGDAISVADLWMRAPHACQAKKRLELNPGTVILKGAYPKWNPFQPPKIIPPKPSLSLPSSNRIAENTYQAEFPLVVTVTGPQGEWKLTAEGLTGTQPALSVQQNSPNEFILTAHPPGPKGSYHLILRSLDGEDLDTEVVHFHESEPLRHQSPATRQGFNASGMWEESASHSFPTLFLHNRFWGDLPLAPDVHGQPLLCLSPAELPDRKFPDMGAMLVAAARRDGSLSIDAFKRVAKEIAMAHGLPDLQEFELYELRRQMRTLGFFHHDFGGRQLELSPLSMWLLPYDRLSLRVLFLGPLPYSVVQYLQEWSRTSNTGIQFEWRYTGAALVPPLLEIRCMHFSQLTPLTEAIHRYFPNALAPAVPQSLSETLLGWLASIPPVPRVMAGGRHDWTSFPEEEERWSVQACTFVRSTSKPTFPALTRTIDRHSGIWYCRWWVNAHHGYDVHHHIAIPHLYHLAGLPSIGQHVAQTDKLVFAGRHRQPDLIERALIMATGNLPQLITARQIPEWEHIFEPDAPFRLFSGIRPPMRMQLVRIYQNVLHLDPSQPFPTIHLH